MSDIGRPSLVKKNAIPMNVMTKISDVPIQCLSNYTVLEAAQLMNESRVHYIIVNDYKTNKLCGLITAKDLAFRVVASELDPQTTVDKIMTSNPCIASVNTSANEALRLMVTKKIRHLPLLDDYGTVVGMLNITKCFYHAMTRLEKMSLEAKKLQCTFNELKETSIEVESSGNIEFSKYSIVDQVIEDEDGEDAVDPLTTTNETSIDFGILERKRKIVNDLKRLIDVMKQPDLKSLLMDSDLEIAAPIFIDTRTSILSAAKILRDSKVTAVLICDSSSLSSQCDHIIGILTSKDIAFRVLASNIDPKTTNIVRVMTPKPNFADETLGIHTALRLMYEGKFLNLPVRDLKGNITGLVSVLQLTYALLKTLDRSNFDHNKESSSAEDLMFDVESNDHMSVNSYENGPAWNRFWGSLDEPLSTVESKEKTSRRSSYNIPRGRASPYVRTNSSNNNTPPASVPSIGPVSINYKRNSSNLSSNFKYCSSSVKSDANSSNTVVNRGRTTDSEDDGSYILPQREEKAEPTKQLDTKSREIKVKLKITETLNLNLNGKIYKLKILPNNEEMSRDLLTQLKKQIYRKLDLDNEEYILELSYLDEDRDQITIDKNEDLETAIESNTKRIVLVLNIREMYGSVHRIRSRDSFFNDEPGERVNTILLLGTIALGAVLISKLISK